MLRCTERDKKLIVKCGLCRWLTTTQIQRLYFPGATVNAVQKRLRKLAEEGYLQTHREGILSETLGGAIPAGDTYETTFTTGQCNIFRQPWQRRTDLSLIKSTQLTERASMKFTFDIFNVTNTASFDIPIDNVSQNLDFNDFPVYGSRLYSSPTLSGLGIVNKTIGSPRQIQMSLKFNFT